MEERTEWKVLGRIIGTGTGWDGEMDCFTIYDFEPASIVGILPRGDITVDYMNGKFIYYLDNGDLAHEFDILEVMGDAI